MAVFTLNKPLTTENTTLAVLDLNSAPHSFLMTVKRVTLTIDNQEVAPLTINLLGDGVTSYICPTYGTIDVSAGKDIVVSAGDTVQIFINKIASYMGAEGNSVAVAVTGSTAPDLAKAWLTEH